MDTSETYIKMCEKATRIWNSWQYQIGDYVVFRDAARFDKPLNVRLVSHVNNAGTIFLNGDHEFQSYEQEKLYPIPRQDQLQEMARDTGYDIYTHKLFDDLEWMMSYPEHFSKSHTANSKEQLWLVYVMRKKYGEVWNGEEWVLKT